jgi:hypothetical protein
MGIDPYLNDYVDREFEGAPFNGPSFLGTLAQIPLAEVGYSGTWEGYSPWQVAHHVLYCKYLIAKELGAAGPLEPYPYEKTDFPPLPEGFDALAWGAFIDYSKKAHDTLAQAIRDFPESRLDEEMKLWKAPFGTIFAWYATHDAYHAAQLRNMGVPSLKKPLKRP